MHRKVMTTEPMCVHACLSVCACECECMCMCAYERQGHQMSLLICSLSMAHRAWIIQVCGFRRLNLYPWACKASTLPTESSPQPTAYFLIITAYRSVLLMQSAHETILEYLNFGQKVDQCGNNTPSL